MSGDPEIRIQNVVASARFEHRIDLKGVVKAFPEAEYRPEKFPGLVFRVKRPKAAMLIFETGRMVCTGAKSEKDAGKAIDEVVRELMKAGIIITSRPEITIQNIVASIDLGNVMIDIEEFVYAAHRSGKIVEYEPDQFPGAVYRMEDPQVAFLIFATGKLVCAGAKAEEEMTRAVEKIVTVLDQNDLLIRA
jgi:transcription initiation factor TFIID TATA-box-binding protein